MKNRLLNFLLSVAAGLCISVPVRGGIPRYHFDNIIFTKYYGGIHSIAKDNTGYVWSCGHEAVIRYDGYEFTNFTSDIQSVAPNDNWNYDNIVMAGGGNVYVGSNHGLLEYDGDKSSFSIVISGNVGGLCTGGNRLWMVLDGVPVCVDVETDTTLREYCIVSDYAVDTPRLVVFLCGGDVFAAWNNHISKLDAPSGTFCDYISLADDISVKDLLLVDGRLFILTLMHGMYVYDADSETIGNIIPAEKIVGAKKLYLDSNGYVWVSSQRGLLFYDPSEGSYFVNSYEANNPNSLPVSSVWDIYGDPDGGVWISTYGGRLAYSDLSLSDIAYYSAGLPYPIVSCFCEAPNGDVWVGTEGGGIVVMTSGMEQIGFITDRDGLASNYVKSINCFDNRYMTVSTYNGGIQRINVAGKMTVSRPMGGHKLSAYSVLPGSGGGMWLTSPDESVMYLTNEGDLSVKTFSAANGISLRGIQDVFRKDGLVFFVTSKGLFAVNENNGEVVCRYVTPHKDQSSNNLCCCCCLRNGEILLGTQGAGVNVLRTDGSYEKLQIEGNVLSNSCVSGILQDVESDNVWLCSEDAFYVLDTETGRISRNYDVKLKGASMYGSAYVSRSGKMYFGGTEGFVSFTPSSLQSSRRQVKVFFSNIRINGENASKEMLMELRQGNALVELDLASNSYSGRNSYAYRVKGLTDTWTILPQDQRTIQLLNPRPGRYALEVRAANSSGLWSDHITEMNVRILPYPWASWWAYCLYVLALASIIVFWVRFNVRRKLLEQQLASEQERSDYLKASALARTKFFTNISHDLKTPLTLLEDPLKRMKENLAEDSPLEKYVNTIERNVNRISHMISQLLHFREIESQKVVLNNQEGDFVRFAKDIFYLFEPYASQKGIEMVFKSQSDSFMIAFDYDVIEKVLSNLCSNAIKYTVTDGLVGMNISYDDSRIHLSVVNTGTGIPDDKKELIFGEFAKLPGQHPNFQSSTGLGLAIVKELVNALDGTIELHSTDSRVEFRVSFPYQKASSESFDLNTEYDYASAEVDNLFSNYVQKNNSSHNSRKANSILVADDDPQMRSYLEMNLSDKFNVYTAADGQDAIAKADRINPQVIVSDLIMPELDGCELCRKIRNDIRISHIPVIVMSGMTGKEAKLNAMEAGANVFMDKPVDIELLITQIEGLIRNVAEMREKYSKRFIAEPAALSISSMDEKLLEKAMACIERNMDNCDYDVDAFVSDMAIGRTVLYRKINDITGMSIKEFIMDIRLKRALQLIKESDYNISEISFMTGFINPKYFSVCFRRHFDMSPSEYKKKLG